LNKIKILVIGKGGREHALVWKLLQSGRVEVVYAAPGNPGMMMEGAQCIPLPFCALEKLLELVCNEDIDLVVIQQDDFLAAGYADAFRRTGVAVFGPSQAAAKIEWSKIYAHELMVAAGIPTPPACAFFNSEIDIARDYVRAKNGQVVVKADGLALGKGAFPCFSIAEALETIDSLMVRKTLGKAGENVLIQERVEGVELSVHAMTDGHFAQLFPFVRDHKHLLDGGKGPMTGGMGIYGPIKIDPELTDAILNKIVLPCIRELDRRKTPFKGLVYPGLMLTADGPQVLEFNARFGDPETQNYMMMLEDDVDLAEAFIACDRGCLKDINLCWKPYPVYSITLAHGAYPGKCATQEVITFDREKVHDGLGMIEVKNFHCGTAGKSGELVTNGGRVITTTTSVRHPDPSQERGWGYQAVRDGAVSFKNMRYRKDIGVVK
jgi:phosphoribosylamine--glycine ligase